MGHPLILYIFKNTLLIVVMSKMTCVFEVPFVLCVFMIDT